MKTETFEGYAVQITRIDGLKVLAVSNDASPRLFTNLPEANKLVRQLVRANLSAVAVKAKARYEWVE